MAAIKAVAALLLVSLALAAGRDLQQAKTDAKPADAKPAAAKTEAAAKPDTAAKPAAAKTEAAAKPAAAKTEAAAKADTAAATVQAATKDKAALAAVASGLTSQPVLFLALIRLRPGADADKFIATREAVAAKYKKDYPGINVAYVKGAAAAKTESLPQGAAKVEYAPVAAIVTAPDAKTYTAYNAAIAKDADYVSSGKDVEGVVRTTNVQT